MLGRIALFPIDESLSSLSNADLVFEAVPETEVAKKEAFQKLDSVLPHQAIFVSTTSTFLADLFEEGVATAEEVDRLCVIVLDCVLQPSVF